jgi:hypothetical protein
MTIADDDNYALNDDGTLEDASQIEWHYNPDDPSPMAQGGSSGGPVGAHVLLSALPCLSLTLSKGIQCLVMGRESDGRPDSS